MTAFSRAFGTLLATRRAALRLGLRDVAKRAGIDPGNLSRIERGLLPPPSETSVLHRMADVLSWAEGSAERSRFITLAHVAGGRIPEELRTEEAALGVLPQVFDAVSAAVRESGEEVSLAEIARALLSQDGEGSPDARTRPAWKRERPSRAHGPARAAEPGPARGVSAEVVRHHEAELQRAFDALLEENDEFARLCGAITRAGARAVVFGGWARDRIASIMFGRALQPADVDLVVDGVASAELEALLPAGAARNAFGGFVTRAGEVKVDIWAVQNTLTFAARGLAPEIDRLPSTTVFTVESVVFKPAQWWGAPAIVEDRLYESLLLRRIDMQDGEIRFPAFQIGRALQYAEKLGLELSPRVLAFMRETLAAPDAAETVRDGIRRFGQPQFRRATLRGFRHVRAALAR